MRVPFGGAGEQMVKTSSMGILSPHDAASVGGAAFGFFLSL
jgi:hypothetical protein